MPGILCCKRWCQKYNYTSKPTVIENFARLTLAALSQRAPQLPSSDWFYTSIKTSWTECREHNVDIFFYAHEYANYKIWTRNWMKATRSVLQHTMISCSSQQLHMPRSVNLSQQPRLQTDRAKCLISVHLVQQYILISPKSPPPCHTQGSFFSETLQWTL